MFRHGGERLDDALVECLEALLAGRYVDYLERRGRRVPAWAWTNLLAHGTEEALHRVMKPRWPLWDHDAWRRARSYLAGEVLDAADRAGSLVTVQAAVLVPLELELVSWRPSRSSSAGEWATRVLAALEDHRRRAL